MRKSRSLLSNVSASQGVFSDHHATQHPLMHSNAPRPDYDQAYQAMPMNTAAAYAQPPIMHGHAPMMNAMHPGHQPQAYPHPTPTPYAGQVYASPEMHTQAPGGAAIPPHAASPDLSFIKLNLEDLATKLNHLAHAQAETQKSPAAGQQELEQLRAQVSNMISSFSDLKQTVDQSHENGLGGQEFNNFKQTLNDNFHSINARLDQLSRQHIDPTDYSSVVETSHENIIHKIQNMQSSMDQIASSPEHFVRTFEAGYGEINQRINQLEQSLVNSRDNDVEAAIGQMKSDIEGQIAHLNTAVERVVENENNDNTAQLGKLEMRLDEITRGIVAISSGGGSAQVDHLERLEARVIELSKDVGTINQNQNNRIDEKVIEQHFARLNTNLQRLDQRMNEIRIASENSESPDIAREMSKLADKIENIGVLTGNGGNPEPVDSALLERLDVLVSRVEHLKDSNSGDKIVRVISQLGARMDQIADNNTRGPDLDVSPLVERLDSFEKQLAANRDIGLEVAGDAAKSAVDNAIGELQALAKSETGLMPDVSAILQPINNRLESMEQQISSSRDISADLASGAASEAVKRAVEEIKQVGSFALQANDSGFTAAFEPISNRLAEIERQLGNHQNLSLEAASGAAEEAVRSAMENAPLSGVEPELLRSLLGDLERLSQVGGAERLESENATQELKEVMLTISQRLESVEENVGQLAQTAPVATPETMATPSQQEQYYQPEVQTGADFAHHSADTENQTGEPENAYQPEAPAPKLEQTPPAAEVNSPAEMIIPTAEEEFNAGLHEPMEPSVAPDKAKTAGGMLVAAARRAEAERLKAMEDAQNKAVAIPVVDNFVQDPAAPEEEFDPATEYDAIKAPSLEMNQFPEVQPNQERVLHTEPTADQTPQEAIDVPLEPGAEGPDLAALVRQANARRKTLAQQGEGASGTDFLAAARRAAQAAALEANQAETSDEVVTKKPSALSKIPNLLKRKSVVVAAAAALLIALAMPIITKFVPTNDTTELAQLNSIESTPEQPQDEVRVVTAETTQTQDLGASRSVRVEEIPVTTASLDPEVDPAAMSDTEIPLSEIQKTQIAAVAIEAEWPEEPGQLTFINDSMKLALANNDPQAAFEVGQRYIKGSGVEKNPTKAAQWYETSANLGYAPAQYIIGNFNEKGIGLTADRVVAEDWYVQAAENGHVIAMHNLAVLYASTASDAKSDKMRKAYHWFEEASEHGVLDSQVNLGILYAKGTTTQVDLVQSYKWFAIAAKSGDKDAGKKRDFISDAMRPDQLTEAKALVAEWQPIAADPKANKITVPADWQGGPNIALNDTQSIAQAQSLLTKLGFDAGPADGVIGDKTRRAIREFRAKTGLTVSETIDTEFMESLFAVSI
ncbi:MAG: peptidoglycan-binding protein [Pseudomonadota bacterium]